MHELLEVEHSALETNEIIPFLADLLYHFVSLDQQKTISIGIFSPLGTDACII